MRQIAVIGLAPHNNQAPAHDPAWETWGLGNDPRAELYDKVFEMHDPESKEFNPKERERILRQREEMKDKLVTLDNYPFAEVERLWRHGWDSSIAYMLSLAALTRPDRIGVWGVDQSSQQEYAHQRENTLLLLGFIEGMGVDLYIHPASKLNLPVRKYPFFRMDKAAPPVAVKLSRCVFVKA
jgi:hypothetical protein